ncbi:MAG: hypothetical protein IPM51_08060 [Sphingobacteriaceae bacterium]|nr:hypothetical protein [Sphingobacteriaceae bacterium]
MKQLFCFLTIILFSACSNSTSEKELLKAVEKIEDQVKADSLFPEILKPLLIARGSESGWYMEVYAHEIKISLDYDEVKLVCAYPIVNFDKEQLELNLTDKTNNNPLKLIIKKEKCTEEASGEIKERSVILEYNSKSYKGCATIEL